MSLTPHKTGAGTSFLPVVPLMCSGYLKDFYYFSNVIQCFFYDKRSLAATESKVTRALSRPASTAPDKMRMDGCDEDVTSLAVQPDASSNIQPGGSAAHSPSCSHCAPAPQIGCVTPKEKTKKTTQTRALTHTRAGTIKSPHQGTYAASKGDSTEPVSGCLLCSKSFFSLRCISPIVCEDPRVLSCATRQNQNQRLLLVYAAVCVRKNAKHHTFSQGFMQSHGGRSQSATLLVVH